MYRVDRSAVDGCMRVIAPAQRRLEQAWCGDLTDPQQGAVLMAALATYNEAAEAQFACIARAFGTQVDAVRERFGPQSDYHAVWHGDGIGFLETALRYGSLDPERWKAVEESYPVARAAERPSPAWSEEQLFDLS